MFDKLYQKIMALSQSPHASWALAAVAFTESSFFPIPPDALLAPMCVAKPSKAWTYAAVCTIASVLGGIVGYLIGYWLYDTIGQALIHLYGYGAKMASLREFYAKWGAWFILIKGVTPIPFKLVTIVSGVLEYNFIAFVGLSIVTRGARFFMLAAALNHFGAPIKMWLDRHFGLFLGLLAAAVVIGFVLTAKLA